MFPVLISSIIVTRNRYEYIPYKQELFKALVHESLQALGLGVWDTLYTMLWHLASAGKQLCFSLLETIAPKT